MSSTVEVPMKGVVSGLILNVRVTGLRAFRARVWLGAQLMRLAAVIIGSQVEISLDD